jgi:hypothetical protein
MSKLKLSDHNNYSDRESESDYESESKSERKKDKIINDYKIFQEEFISFAKNHPLNTVFVHEAVDLIPSFSGFWNVAFVHFAHCVLLVNPLSIR